MFEQVTPVGWGPPHHIHLREDEIFCILGVPTNLLYVGDERRSVTAGRSAVLPGTFRSAFATWRPHPYRSSLPADWRSISLPWRRVPLLPIPHDLLNWHDRSV